MDLTLRINLTTPQMPLVTTSSRAPFSGWLFLIAQLILLLAIALRPSPFRQLLFIPILLIYWRLIVHTTTGNLTTDNPTGTILATSLLIASDHILLTDVQRELRLRLNKGDENATQCISDAPFKQRLIWAWKLITSPRGIGWEHEPTRYIRPATKAGTPTARWIIHQLARIATLIFIYDVGNIIARWKVTTPSDPTTFLRHPWIMRFIGMATYGHPAMCAIEVLYTILGILSVVIGFSKPEEWPPLFGELKQAYTIRRFWARVWHQLLRKTLLSHSKFITHQVFGLKPNTPLARYLYLYISFFITASIHQIGEYMMLSNWTGTAFYFFFGQAFAISFEEGVMAFGRYLGIDYTRHLLLWRMVGYIWLAGWLTYALDPIMSEMMIRSNDHFSLVLGLWRGEWSPKLE